MSDRGIQAVREHLAKLPPSNTLTIEQRRKQYERAERVFPTPADVTIDRVTTPTRPAERLRPPGVRTDAAVLYLHGGGYVIGSPSSHRHLAAAIARAAGVQALLLDYRLAPEHPFPAALDDALAAYQWLQTQGVARRTASSSPATPRAAGSPWPRCSRCATARCRGRRAASASRRGSISRAAAPATRRGPAPIRSSPARASS